MLTILFLSSAFATTGPEWRAAMGSGDCSGVVRLLPSPSSEIERLAAARCLEHLDQDGRALEVLGTFNAPLAPYAALVKAKALLDRGDPAGAVTALELALHPLAGEVLLEELVEGQEGEIGHPHLAYPVSRAGSGRRALGSRP